MAHFTSMSTNTVNHNVRNVDHSESPVILDENAAIEDNATSEHSAAAASIDSPLEQQILKENEEKSPYFHKLTSTVRARYLGKIEEINNIDPFTK